MKMMTPVLELIGQVANVITASAAAAAAWSAWRSLSIWRAEMRERRRAEVAERVLASFYRAHDIYQSARNPFVHAFELTTREGEPEKHAGNPDYVPLRRLQEHEKFLASFRAAEYEFAALFGAHAHAPFEIFRDVHNKIVIAFEDIVREQKAPGNSKNSPLLVSARSVLRAPPDANTDEIGKRLSQAVENVECICRPEIEARALLYRRGKA